MVDIKIDFKKNQTFLALRDIDKAPAKGLASGIRLALLHLRSAVDKNLASGKFGIKSRSGMLRASLGISVKKISGRIAGVMGTNLVYARIQESGGSINVTARMSKFAWYKFKDTGNDMWKAIALSKGQQIKIPAHWYMRDTFKIEKNNVNKIINQAIEKELALGLKG